MARIPRDSPRTRLSLELPERVRERLEQLRELSSADTLSEVIRRSLAVYDALLTTTANGGSVVLRKADGTEERLLIP